MHLYTLIHLLISLVALGAGFVVIGGMLAGRIFPRWNALFLAATIATSVTGFGFPFEKFLPSHGVAIVSLAVLAVAVWAYYGKRLAGRRRTIYVFAAVMAQYLNFFVLIAQLFLRVPALIALAPTQSEPPFAATQLVVLAAFVVVGLMTLKSFRPVELAA